MIGECEKDGLRLSERKEPPLIYVVLLPRCLFRGETVKGDALIRICCSRDSSYIVFVLTVHLDVKSPLRTHNPIRVMKSIPAPLLQNGRVRV